MATSAKEAPLLPHCQHQTANQARSFEATPLGRSKKNVEPSCFSVEYFSATVRVTPEGGDRLEEVPAMKVIPAVAPSYQNLWIRSLVSESRMTSPLTPCPLLESCPAK